MKKTKRDKYKVNKDGEKKEYKILNPTNRRSDKYYEAFTGYETGFLNDF